MGPSAESLLRVTCTMLQSIGLDPYNTTVGVAPVVSLMLEGRSRNLLTNPKAG